MLMIPPAVFALAALARLLAPDNPAALTFTAAVVGDAPLPGQAVRLRVEVQNAGPAPRVGLIPLQQVCRVAVVGTPGGPVDPGRRALIARKFRDCHPIDCTGGGYDRTPLPPGGRRAVSFALGLGVAPVPGAGNRTPEPLFPAPGVYTLRCEYLSTVDVEVRVGRPGPADAPWADALAKDPALGLLLLRPGPPCGERHARAIEGLLETAPGSSYAAYGRLALGAGFRPGPGRSLRVAVAMAADALEPLGPHAKLAGFPFRPLAYAHLAEVDAVAFRNSVHALFTEFPESLEWRNAWRQMPETSWPRGFTPPGCGPHPAAALRQLVRDAFQALPPPASHRARP